MPDIELKKRIISKMSASAGWLLVCTGMIGYIAQSTDIGLKEIGVAIGAALVTALYWLGWGKVRLDKGQTLACLGPLFVICGISLLVRIGLSLPIASLGSSLALGLIFVSIGYVAPRRDGFNADKHSHPFLDKDA